MKTLKTLSIALPLLLCTSVFADENSIPGTSNAEVESSSTETSYIGRFQVEIRGTALGEYVGNKVGKTDATVSMDDSPPQSFGVAGSPYSDISLDISVYRFLTNNAAIGITGPVFIFGDFLPKNAVPNLYTFVKPVMLGMKYQLHSFLDTPQLRPAFGLEFGAVLLDRFAFGERLPLQARFGVRPSANLDYFPFQKSDFFMGTKLSYLFVKDYSNMEAGVSLGYLF
ncbi:hypothetical protein K2X30_02605 [bacterium]|jgi:hypothetical protein|nr:hypothetical protein [bacterium]